MIELDSHVRYWVREGRRGSSGRLRRYLSRANLNSSRVQSVRLLMDAGRELNSLGPLWGRVANLMDLIRSGAEAAIGGGTQVLPLLPLTEATMGVESKLGTSFSRILQVYNT